MRSVALSFRCSSRTSDGARIRPGEFLAIGDDAAVLAERDVGDVVHVRLLQLVGDLLCAWRYRSPAPTAAVKSTIFLSHGQPYQACSQFLM